MYRTNCPPPTEPPEPKEVVPFKRSYPIAYKIGRAILGAVTTVVVGLFVFPGVAMFGQFISDNLYGLHHITGNGSSVAYWLVGIFTLLAIPVVVGVSIVVGKEIETALE
jgi:hypothetical protein